MGTPTAAPTASTPNTINSVDDEENNWWPSKTWRNMKSWVQQQWHKVMDLTVPKQAGVLYTVMVLLIAIMSSCGCGSRTTGDENYILKSLKGPSGPEYEA